MLQKLSFAVPGCLGSLLVWDVLVPAGVFAICLAAQLAPPQFPDATGFAGYVSLAGAAYRFQRGRHGIDVNRCGERFRTVQYSCLGAGIFCLMIIDVAVIFMIENHGNAMLIHIGDTVAIGIVYGFYLAFMAVVTYPGHDSETRVPKKDAAFVSVSRRNSTIRCSQWR